MKVSFIFVLYDFYTVDDCMDIFADLYDGLCCSRREVGGILTKTGRFQTRRSILVRGSGQARSGQCLRPNGTGLWRSRG